MMLYILTALLFAVGIVVCEDDTTQLPDLSARNPKDNNNENGGHHVYGSNPITRPNGQTYYQNRQRGREYEDPDHHNFGVLLPFPRTTPKSYKNAQHNAPGLGLPIVRNVNGRGPPPHAPYAHDAWPNIRHSIRGEVWDHSHNHDNVYVQPPRFLDDQDELMDNERSGGSSAIEVSGPTEPICTKKCDDSEFLCSKSCICIHKELYCDGHIDCGPSAEDEEECTMSEATIKKLKEECEADIEPKHVMCPNTHICIKQEWLCDGDDDCGDFTDETHCGSKANCSEDQFECFNGLCIPQEWLCDGDNDCRDNSDELNCTRQCTNDEFQCLDSSCVSIAFKCDGEIDCPDGSDETTSCDFPLPNCPEGEFKCKGLVGGMGGPGGRCVLQRFRCDGDNDCGDWSDEENCPRKPTSCTSNEFKCDDGKCIPLRWRCDSEQDCDSGEDEKGCSDLTSDVRECSDDEYMCKDNRCILKTWVCDGVADCKRGEDESDCEAKCEVGQFLCPTAKTSNVRQKISSICVNQKHICDKVKDCQNGEDELDCPIEHPCPANTKCEQNCVTSAKGNEECACRVGFVLHSNGYNCTDIDECQFTTMSVCSQTCTNTYGGFRCGCINGYVLRPDLRTCKALGGAVKLIMANRADIRQVTLSNNQYISIIKGLPNAIALDYHYQKDLLFWTDVSADVVKQSFLNGTNVKDVIKWGLESPGGIAVDWIHELLFWTDSGTRRVEVSTFDGKLRAVIAANDLDKPRAIVVHPGENFVFWSDWGPNAKIERAYMDGSDRRAITSDGIYWPNGLAVDYAADRIYWADAKHHVIENSKLDGSDRKKILSNNLPHPFALTIFEDGLYWTDWHTKTISTANKITGKGFRHVHEGLRFPMDIHSYHVARQPNYTNHCPLDSTMRKGGCSHLCLPVKGTRRCSCPIGLTLLNDGKTCTTVPDKLLLLARKKDIRIRQLDSQNPLKEVDMVIPLDGLKSTIALDWCSETDQIFWTDVGRSTISRAFLNGSNQETIISANLASPAGLAYDWVTKKLYFTDAGTNRIEVSSLDGRQRTLLIWQNLLKPRDIVVNPIKGLMFWSDWSETPLIERAGMDGTSRISIVSENLLYPNGLAIDHSSDRLYFVDAGTHALEFVNFDGTGRNRLISDGLMHPFGLDVYEKYVCWSDWDLQSIQLADKFNGKNRRSIVSNTSDLMDIRVFHRKRRNIRNPCAIQNGNCSHMCLLNPRGSYTCACPIGVKLTDDNRTCKDGPSSYILFAHRIDIRQVSLDIEYTRIDVVLPLPPISNVIALDVDLVTGYIYWADTIEDVIMRSSSDGTKTTQIIGESLDNVDGLVIDSAGRKIYWTDVGRHSIEVSELDGSHRKVIVWQDLEQPRGIAVDYKHGYLFFSDWGTSPRIERADMDGERRSRIVTNYLGWPNGLAADKDDGMLYWTDAHYNHIESCDFNGNFRKKIVLDLPHPYGIAVTKSHVYWTDWKSNALHAVEKTNLTARSIIASNLEGLMDVKVVQGHEDVYENVCGDNNGGCSHLCLRKPNGYSCQCPTGIKMKEDGKNCEELPKSYLLIALRSGIGRISLDTPELFDVVLPIDGVHGAVVVDFHFKRNYLFYADVNVDAIRRVDMKNYTDTKTIVASGLNTPNGLAVDWLADNIYWSDSALKIIEVARLDGTCRKTLLRDDLDDVRALILFKQYLFFADWGHAPRIERSLLDGSDRRSIVNSDLGFPTGLAIDFSAKKLYWADALQDKIEMCDFDGKNRKLVIPHAEHPFGFTLTSNFYYYTDWYNKSVVRMPRQGGSSEEIRHNLRGALEIRSVSSERQPTKYWNPCSQDNGGCSHLCLFKGNSYACVCPNIPDSRACRTQPAFQVSIKRLSGEKDEDEEVSLAPSTTEPTVVPAITHTHLFYIILILTAILLLVLILILMLMINSKRRRSRKESTRQLTFSNPNYNGADYQVEGPSRGNIWKRFKYDKAQDRVYEEKVIGPETASSTLMSSTNPSPMPSHSGLPLPLSTIG